MIACVLFAGTMCLAAPADARPPGRWELKMVVDTWADSPR
jgi:hypothetical protein